MNYANIKYFDIADGEGVRTSLFVSGCRRGCKNCFNSVAWDFAAGEPFDRAVEDKIIESLDHPFIDGLTILGGEPMEPENQVGLVDFVERVRAAYPVESGKTIWCFTGDVLEELVPGGRHHTEVTLRAPSSACCSTIPLAGWLMVTTSCTVSVCPPVLDMLMAPFARCCLRCHLASASVL